MLSTVADDVNTIGPVGPQLEAWRHQAQWYASEIDFRGAYVVDVGANVGGLSEWFWRLADGDIQLVSVEPHPENWSSLESRRQRVTGLELASGGQEAVSRPPSWRIERCAVSNSLGRRPMSGFREASGVWNSAIAGPPMTSENPATPEQVVCQSSPVRDHFVTPCRPLHELAPRAEIVKLDVEGHEYDILDASSTHMPQLRALLIEFHYLPDRPLERELDRLSACGFDLFAATQRRGDRSGTWVSRPIDPRLTWDHLPVAKRRPDGSVFKMLHVLARRSGAPEPGDGPRREQGDVA